MYRFRNYVSLPFVRLQTLEGTHIPNDARLIALEGFFVPDAGQAPQLLNGRPSYLGEVFIDEAILYSPALAARYGDVHLGFFKMKMPRMSFGKMRLPKIGRIRLPNIGKQFSKFGQTAQKFVSKAGKGLEKFGKKISQAAQSAFDQFSNMAPGAEAPEAAQQEEMPQQEDASMPPDESFMPEDENSVPVEDLQGQVLGFLPALTAALPMVSSLLPGISSALPGIMKAMPGLSQGNISSLIPGISRLSPAAGQFARRANPALQFAMAARRQQSERKRQRQLQQRMMLQQVARQVLPPQFQQFIPPPPQRLVVQPSTPTPLRIRPQVQQIAQEVEQQFPQQQVTPREVSGPDAALVALGVAGVVGVAALLFRNQNQGQRRRK